MAILELHVIKTKFGIPNCIYKVIGEQFVTLLHFQKFGEHLSPEKFKIILSHENSILDEYVVELYLDKESGNYMIHNLGISFNPSDTKIEIIPINVNQIINQDDRVSYSLIAKISDNDEGKKRNKIPKPNLLYIEENNSTVYNVY